MHARIRPRVATITPSAEQQTAEAARPPAEVTLEAPPHSALFVGVSGQRYQNRPAVPIQRVRTGRYVSTQEALPILPKLVALLGRRQFAVQDPRKGEERARHPHPRLKKE